jgi:hypothetical protein
MPLPRSIARRGSRCSAGPGRRITSKGLSAIKFALMALLTSDPRRCRPGGFRRPQRTCRTAERIAPTASKGRLGSGAKGSSTRRLTCLPGPRRHRRQTTRPRPVRVRHRRPGSASDSLGVNASRSGLLVFRRDGVYTSGTGVSVVIVAGRGAGGRSPSLTTVTPAMMSMPPTGCSGPGSWSSSCHAKVTPVPTSRWRERAACGEDPQRAGASTPRTLGDGTATPGHRRAPRDARPELQGKDPTGRSRARQAPKRTAPPRPHQPPQDRLRGAGAARTPAAREPGARPLRRALPPL